MDYVSKIVYHCFWIGISFFIGIVFMTCDTYIINPVIDHSSNTGNEDATSIGMDEVIY
jgi:hypothetical protein